MSQAASSGNSRPILGVSKSQEGDAGKKKTRNFPMEEKYKWLKKLSTPPHFWHGFRSLKTKVYLLRVPLWVPTKGDPPVTAT